MSFAPTGDKLCASILDTSEVFRFDRCTGLLTPMGQLSGSYGGAFSPDGQLFYQLKPDRQGTHIYQYDLSVPTSFYQGSIIGTIQPEDSTLLIATGQIQQGPDDKLYLLPEKYTYLSVISKPNAKGRDCQLEEKKISIKSTNRRYPNGAGLPNMPNYRLGAMRCPPDARPETTKSSYFEFYPNPANESVTVCLSPTHTGTAILRLSDLCGRVVKEASLDSGESVMTLSGVPAGIYLLTLISEAGHSTEKLIVE